MADKVVPLIAKDNDAVPIKYHDNGDGTYSPAVPAGTAVIGKVGIDQTTPGTTDSVSVATGQGAGAVIGEGGAAAAVTTDANGTLYQYLRGLVAQHGAVTASPVANTVLDRLKAIKTSLDAGALVFNETSTDLVRGNTSGQVALASAARTAAVASGNFVNYNGKGLWITLNVTAKAAATTLQVFVGAYEPVLDVATSICTFTAVAAAAGSNYGHLVYPGVLNADMTSPSQAKSLAIPRNFYFVVTPSDANSVTYSLYYGVIE